MHVPLAVLNGVISQLVHPLYWQSFHGSILLVSINVIKHVQHLIIMVKSSRQLNILLAKFLPWTKPVASLMLYLNKNLSYQS